MDLVETDRPKTENKSLEFMKDVGLDFVTTAASSAGVVAGVAVVAFVYNKLTNRSTKRRHKKENQETQPQS